VQHGGVRLGDVLFAINATTFEKVPFREVRATHKLLLLLLPGFGSDLETGAESVPWLLASALLDLQVTAMLRDRNMLKKTLKFCSMSEYMRRR
jgi:hypothetical protein